MVNQDVKPQDGFYELLQTQIPTDIPSHLEMRIMREVQKASVATVSSINIRAIFIFGILSFVYVMLAVISSYYFPNMKELKDLQILLGLGILIHLLYEANEALPNILQQWMSKKILKG
ncbi:MAG: hypothetical protein IPK62_09200 [Bacteroidetes bacterium]|nr:hypothetical protein [Bacteroidota bacterium]MBK8145148.1 hypothetical protein [Bacteroidota bacterium]MBP6316174.1 hypothetical protein [Chitinophagaceae bacterium]